MLLLAGVAWVLRCAPAWMRPVQLNTMQHRRGAGEYMLWQCINDRMCEGLRPESFKVVGWLRAYLPWARCGVAVKEWRLPRLHDGDAGDVLGSSVP
jgi:hypothetical protein